MLTKKLNANKNISRFYCLYFDLVFWSLHFCMWRSNKIAILVKQLQFFFLTSFSKEIEGKKTSEELLCWTWNFLHAMTYFRKFWIKIANNCNRSHWPILQFLLIFTFKFWTLFQDYLDLIETGYLVLSTLRVKFWIVDYLAFTVP